MQAHIPYVFYRYSIENDGVPVDGSLHYDLLTRLEGKRAAYRRLEPTEENKDSFFWALEKRNVGEEEILLLEVAKHLARRKVKQFIDGEMQQVVAPADECKTCSVIMIPSMGALAAEDLSGDSYIDANSAMGRLREIFRLLPLYSFNPVAAGSADDVMTALTKWKIEQVNFSARPFNPSVSHPGDKLHTLLHGNNAKITGKAMPVRGKYMSSGENGGIIEEMIGLAGRGYAEIGVRGETGEGLEMQIQKGMISGTDSQKKKKMRVFFPKEDSFQLFLSRAVSSIRDIFSR